MAGKNQTARLTIRYRALLLIASILCISALPPPLGAQDPVPADYRQLYNTLDKQMSAAEQHFGTRQAAAGKTVFTTELLSANAAQGDLLLSQRTLQGSILLLDRFRAMGFGGIWISIKYPLLMPDYPDSSAYLDFYRQIAVEARKRDLAVCVDLGSFFSDPNLSRTHADYSKLTLKSFAQGIHTMAEIIIRELKPDYLGILNEPDTQAKNTGLDLSVDNLREFARLALTGLERGTARIGIGAGTWSPLSYFEMMARDTTVDCLDLHIYPINRDYMTERIDKIAALAAANGKQLVIGESWLYKAADDELGHDIAQSARIFTRDVYDFWTPLDARFIAAMMRLSRIHNVGYCNFFWSRNFFGVVPYTAETSKLEPQQAFDLIRERGSENILRGSYSALGEEVRKMLTH